MDSSVVLSVGDTYHLRFGKDHIVYAAMPSEKVYSVVQRKRNFVPYAAWGYARNIFLP
jgi:hypothetical protein